MKSYLENNLSALARLSPPLAERMRSLSLDASLTVDETKSGHPSLRAKATDGVEIRLHSEYDPAGEAKQFVERRPPEKTDAIVLSGLGLAYHAREIARRMPKDSWLFLVEAREDLFRAGLECVDLAGLFSRPKTLIFVGSDWVSFLDWSRAALEASEAQRMSLVTYPPCIRLAPDFYERVAAEFQIAVNRRMVELNTLIQRAEEIETNAIRNLAFLPESRGVRDFAGAFDGVPAIVVAAGPSLGPNLAELKKAVGRCVLVSVGKPLSLLMENGIEPEFVASLDMSSESIVLFEGYELPKSSYLLFDGDAAHNITRAYPGPKVTYETPTPVAEWGASVFGAHGDLPKGLSVAHSAFFFARALGADPIILVGVDLAVPGDRTHAEGVTMTWGGGAEDKKRDWLDIPGVQGKPVRSLRNFQSMVTAFDVEVAKTKAVVINTTPDGALIRGTENMSLQDALAKHATKDVPIRARIDEKTTDVAPFAPEAFEAATAEVVKGVEAIREMCESGRRAVKRAQRLNPDNRLDAQEINKLGRRLEKTKNEIIAAEWTKMLNRITSSTKMEIRRLSRGKAEIKERNEIVKLELKLMKILFDGFKDGADFFLREFGEMKKELLSRQKGA